MYYIIPDISNISKTIELTTKYNLGLEYNDFTFPEVYDDKEKLEETIQFYLGLDRDRSSDTMHGAFLGVDIAAVDPILREYSQKLCKQSLEIAKRLGIKGVVFHTGLIGTLRVGYYVNNWLDVAGSFFGKLCKAYRRMQLKILQKNLR